MKLLKTTLLLTKDRLKLPLKKMLKKHSITHTFFLFPDNKKQGERLNTLHYIRSSVCKMREVSGS